MEAFPLQEITLRGLPDDVPGIGLEAMPLDGRGSESGEPVLLYAVRLESGEPVFVAPAHPAGLDAGGRFRIVLEDEHLSLGEPPVLTVKPLPAASGQAARLLDDLGGFVERVAVAVGGDSDRLRDGPIEDVPAHLLGAAVGLRAVEEARSTLSTLDEDWADRWLATRPALAATAEFLDRVAEFPKPPDEVRRDPSTGSSRTEATTWSTEPHVHFAGFTPNPATGATALSSRPPWDKIEICSRCPGALNHYMNLQTELELGYASLAERMARDRDLFDFLESLDGPPPGATTQKMEKVVSKARAEARKRAGNPLSLETPASARRGLALYAAIEGVFELTIGLNDMFLEALLPSVLLPSGVTVTPLRFNEDDKRAEPQDEGSGTWRLRVTARSKQVSVSARELFEYFKRLKSIVGEAESGVFGSPDEGMKSGLCVPGGSAPKESEAFGAEVACGLAGDIVDKTSKALAKYDRARKGVSKAKDALGLDDDVIEPLPDLDFDAITFGPFDWRGIDVSSPKWSTARALGECVRVMALTWASVEPWTQLAYSPADPVGSWGYLSDEEKPPEIGLKPAALGNCDLRISTRVDRFGDAPPVHIDVGVGVDEIRLRVDPTPVTLEPTDSTTFEATVWNADSLDVGWSASAGDGREVPCESEVNGRPCYRWKAPPLEQGECRRYVRVMATSLARRGLRESGEPPRQSFAAVEVVDPAADLSITRAGKAVAMLSLEPEEDTRLAVAGPAAKTEVEWSATGGSFSGSGSQVTYKAPKAPGSYRVTASTSESLGCAPSVLVTVIPGEDGYDLAVSGDASAQQSGSVAFRGLPVEVPSISTSGNLCLVSLRFERPPYAAGLGPVGVAFGLEVLVDGALQERPYTVASEARADDGIEYHVLLPPGTGARGRVLSSTLAAPNVFHTGLALGHDVETHYGETTAVTTETAGPDRERGHVYVDHVDENRIVGTFDVQVEHPYRLLPTGPDAGTWYRDEVADFRVTGGFAASFETTARYRGIVDDINYCVSEDSP